MAAQKEKRTIGELYLPSTVNQICASVPALRPLLAFYAPHLFQISFSNGCSGSPSTANNRGRKLQKTGSLKNTRVAVSTASQEPVVRHHSGGDFSDFHDLHESHHSQNTQDMHILDDELNENNSHALQEFHDGGVYTMQAFDDTTESSQATYSTKHGGDEENPYSPTDSIGIFRPTNVDCWYEERDSESGKSTPPKPNWRRGVHQQEQPQRFEGGYAV